MTLKNDHQENNQLLSEYKMQVMPQKESLKRHIILFILTVFTTMAAGALLRGHFFWESPDTILLGIPYSFSILFILLSHEMGHYLMARKYGVKATLPYFIFFWIPGFNLGTMGAFIKMKSRIPHRTALLHIGIAGPLAGFMATLIVLFWGFWNLNGPNDVIKIIESIHPISQHVSSGTNLTLGNSLLFYLFHDVWSQKIIPMNEIYHFPFIFAGWVGLLITALNLMPIGQLDGGHISYALFGSRARSISLTTFASLLLLLFFSLNYLIWVILIFFIVKFQHPPTLNDQFELSPKNKLLAYSGYIIFMLCFIPIPFDIL